MNDTFIEEDIYKHLQIFARDGRALPRFRTRKAKITVTDKYSRHRQKCMSENHCPHCGKVCTPFYECSDRRASKTLNYILRKMVKAGEILVVSDRKGLPKTYRSLAKK